MLGTCSTSTNNCTGNSFCPDSTTTSTDCLPCKSECLTCSGTSASSTICKTCHPGMFLTASNTCADCDPKCYTCETSKSKCTNCRPSDELIGNDCLTSCISNSDCRSNQICDEEICENCVGNCVSCSGTIYNCSNCSNGYGLIQGVCSKCTDSNCDKCDGQVSTCKKCKSGFRLQGASCQACAVHNCSTYGASNSDICVTCLAGYKMSNIGTCSECSSGYFMSENGCQKCDTTCHTCRNNAKTCEICTDLHQPTIQQTCQPICASHVPDGSACDDGVSKPCGAETQITACQCTEKVNCFTCNSDNTQCETCLKGYKLVNGDCQTCVQDAEMIDDFCILGVQDNLNRSLSGGAVAGIVIAIIVIIGGIGGGVFWYLKKSKTQLKNVSQGGVMQE
ncbi:Cysteine-rich membrane protein 2 [Spironucleus salmonicida]|uniref:Cysteine-rich membrane protein 2 n=1 Tax=Spironucleus salmonicida TaxID=348837 RepID=V6LLJ0_9EUKA|nr:Cysteine-rich membrane protein 2 [Spironucleus salmonicida]|eukprot:EST45535.1 Cysteine-rich membrane protein 2 [Spironucleus salmonicida]